MPSVTNPFTSGTPLASATANNRYPLSNALFANSQPTGVPTSYNFTLTNLEIAAVNAGIAQIQKGAGCHLKLEPARSFL